MRHITLFLSTLFCMVGTVFISVGVALDEHIGQTTINALCKSFDEVYDCKNPFVEAAKNK